MKDWRKELEPSIYADINTDKLFLYIAKRFVELGASCQKKNSFFSVALGGGKTPIILNKEIVEVSKYYNLDWTRVFLSFSDERCVPKENDSSNYKMIYETLIKPLNIPNCNVLRIQGELGAEAAAIEYEKDIQNFFDRHNTDIFDLALLGLGEDGHTASLFPKAEALKEKHRLITPGGKGKEGLERVTMSYPLLNSSDNIWFLICGEEKRKAFEVLLNGEYNPDECPAQGIYCKSGNITYFTNIKTK